MPKLDSIFTQDTVVALAYGFMIKFMRILQVQTSLQISAIVKKPAHMFGK